jgi:hypothetical protein
MDFHVKGFSSKIDDLGRTLGAFHFENCIHRSPREPRSARIFKPFTQENVFFEKNYGNLVLEGGLDPAGIRLLIMRVKLF